MEIFKSNYYERARKEYPIMQQTKLAHPSLSRAQQWELVQQSLLIAGGFDQTDFYCAFHAFDHQSILLSIQSPNAIVRLMAILDRRVGKRRLRDLAQQIELQPEWLQFFYYLRIDAEGIRLPEKSLN